MRFPTEALRAAGVRGVPRDPVAVSALPGDLYDLAPASSQDLGEEAWQVHVAWAMQKAQSVVRPAVGLLSTDLMDSARIEQAAGEAGYRVETWRGLPTLGERRPSIAFIDLTHADADDAIRLLADAGVRVVAFGPHVDDLAMIRARSLGAADALARPRFFRTIPELLPESV